MHEPTPTPEQITASGPGPLLGVLALTLSLGCAAGGYWLWTQMPSRAALPVTDGQQSALNRVDARLAELEQGVRQLQVLHQQFEGEQQQQAARLAALGRVEAELAALRRLTPEQVSSLALAEAEYLLRIATHRLQLAHDLGGAEAALHAADLRLLSVPARYAPVRDRIAQALAQLAVLEPVDPRRLAEAIGELIDGVDTLPLRPRYTPASLLDHSPLPGTDADAEGFEGLKQRFSALLDHLVEVRRYPSGVTPLPPESRRLLHHELRLLLEGARLAAIERNANLYLAQLGDALQRLDAEFDGEQMATQNLQRRLKQLLTLEIDPPMPDLSAPLTTLQRLRSEALAQGDEPLPRPAPPEDPSAATPAMEAPVQDEPPQSSQEPAREPPPQVTPAPGAEVAQPPVEGIAQENRPALTQPEAPAQPEADGVRP